MARDRYVNLCQIHFRAELILRAWLLGIGKAGTLGFRPFVLNHPVLFQIGFQKTLSSEVAQAMVPAAERALTTLHRRIARLRGARRLGARTVPDAAWEFHAACEGLATLELRRIAPPEHAKRLWQDTLSALVAGWQHVTPGATPTETPCDSRQPAITAPTQAVVRKVRR